MKVNVEKNNRAIIKFADGTQFLVHYETIIAAFVPGEGWFVLDDPIMSMTSKKAAGQWISGDKFKIGMLTMQATFQAAQKREVEG